MRTSSQPSGKLQSTLAMAWQGLLMWTPRQINAAVLSTVAVALLIGVATVLIPNPLFARDIPPVWWNYPIWLLTAVLSGMLMATYIRPYSAAQAPPAEQDDAAGKSEKRSSRLGLAGTFLAWFAVGCPVCNKIALLALGYSGAINYFTPVQPFLAAGAIIFCSVALVLRLKGQVTCPVPRAIRKNAQAHETAGV